MNIRSKGSSESKGLLEFQNSDTKVKQTKNDRAHENLNLQKLLTEKGIEETGQTNQELGDLLINKQSFSANPRELKKQAESINFL